MAEQRQRPTDALKLLARDEEDLAVISAILQDALIPVSEMAFLPEEQRFALVANRFRWEAPGDRPRESLERRLTGLSVGGVTAVALLEIKIRPVQFAAMPQTGGKRLLRHFGVKNLALDVIDGGSLCVQ